MAELFIGRRAHSAFDVQSAKRRGSGFRLEWAIACGVRVEVREVSGLSIAAWPYMRAYNRLDNISKAFHVHRAKKTEDSPFAVFLHRSLLI